MLVRWLPAALAQRQELVAEVDERHPRRPAAQLELEESAVEGQRLLDVADLERDVVDADQTPALAHLLGLGRDRATTPETVPVSCSAVLRIS